MIELNKFYVTTPIYYVNDFPHAGHAYTTIAADILARWNRIKGKQVFFLTVLDKHGEKIYEAALEKALTTQELVDLLAPKFKEVSIDRFRNTSSAGAVKFRRNNWRQRGPSSPS